jgi:hypothetical protein
MSEGTKQPEADQPAKRGDAAWREAKESVAARNDATRRAGKQERENRDNEAAAQRRAEQLRELGTLSSVPKQRR